jgi:hypothetical protein
MLVVLLALAVAGRTDGLIPAPGLAYPHYLVHYNPAALAPQYPASTYGILDLDVARILSKSFR